MPKGASAFKKGDLRRALESAQSAGMFVSTAEIQLMDGGTKIVLKFSKDKIDQSANEWDTIAR